MNITMNLTILPNGDIEGEVTKAEGVVATDTQVEVLTFLSTAISLMGELAMDSTTSEDPEVIEALRRDVQARAKRGMN